MQNQPSHADQGTAAKLGALQKHESKEFPALRIDEADLRQVHNNRSMPAHPPEFAPGAPELVNPLAAELAFQLQTGGSGLLICGNSQHDRTCGLRRSLARSCVDLPGSPAPGWALGVPNLVGYR